MQTKKVLIIAYYWPPSGGSGVQRWLKFVKYLPTVGVKPYVFTPANPSFAIKDESLLLDVPREAEVIRYPIWEPYEIFFKLSSLFGKKKTAKPTDVVSLKSESIFQRLSTWVRGNLFIPDPRKFWVKPSVKFLEHYLREHNIGTVITTGPPHSMHLIGLKLKQRNSSLKWIADFRDPWSEWGFLDSIRAGERAKNKHRKLERLVTTTADEVLTITPFYVRQFERLSGRKVQLLTNGFDEDDFKNLVVKKSSSFIIRHVGIINEKCNPRPFMRAIEKVLQDYPQMKQHLVVDFIGDVHPAFRAFVVSNPSLKAATTFTPSIPHKQLIAKYGEASVLLLVLTGYKDAEGYMPGKLFEYIATSLPVLGVGPEVGDAADLLHRAQCGRMIDGENTNDIADFIVKQYRRWETEQSMQLTTSAGLTYSRRKIAESLAALL
ncbi:glycosyltransferase family protein [Pseudochryseolinea flava]|uniref:Glycosyl transferase n=1 Tax=Pseudochryseolinea flava TaxID=2059302 RepID=A0A364XX42_9BACT|nr:glycosyl transferase [Pseudochryseolinea flava]RAV98556.1 glycosyl transferase [Pseudochryseolinea flava]